ncbi:MAG: hypothetical protein Kow0092_06510 [Deferrisomatales bacterium]
MRDLGAPIRVTWELPADSHRAAAVWSRLVEARVLLAEVHIPPGPLSGLPGLATAIGKGGGPRLSLAAPAGPLLAAIEALGPRTLAASEFLLLPPFEPVLDVEDLAAATHRLVPAVWATPSGLGYFSEALEVARGYRLAEVAVLNPPAPAAPLGPEDRRRAAETWRRRGGAPLGLRVHDLFLAEAVGLDPWPAYTGCQGADALAHVTASGRLTACRTLPVDLGDLLETPLMDLWAAAPRKGVRARLARAPAGCRGCVLVDPCAGGCRGLSADLGRDPSCPGPRAASHEGASDR